ncbi:serine/threonine-protein kinase pakE-like [Eupeodes corollae]|uniref:serine/threonine-protein kinase pakE-like n=1 Tax=Eupeodes corollae TaxID=290404 RepID=UPI00249220D9|nr:serine/threonine-protein kinase pakE-like [Eupeodes corollae]
MKLTILKVIFLITVLLTTFAESFGNEQNRILDENLSEVNFYKEHTSRIQRRSIVRLFGLKPRYRRPNINISWNWGNSNQQRFITTNSNNNNRIYHKTFSTIPNGLQIQKNILIYNGLNGVNNQHNSQIFTTTTPKYFTTRTTAGSIFEKKPSMDIDNTFSTKPTESSITKTRYSASTEAVMFNKEPTTQNVGNTKITQVDQTTTSTTSKPKTPITTRTTTELIASNNLSTKSSKGGFTSTSMPQNNEYSELIYDIDPRYRKK